MLYLLELFNQQNIAVELNLICQFDNQNYFEAIFNGCNKYKYTKVLPEIWHNYLRQIRFDKLQSSIDFYLKNINTETDEIFILNLLIIPHFLTNFQTVLLVLNGGIKLHMNHIQ